VKRSKRKDSELVGEAVSAFRETRVPDGPSPEVLSTILEAGSALEKDLQPITLGDRRITMKRIAKIAVAAALLVGACIGYSYLVPAPDGGSAYADDLLAASRQIERAKTVTWKTKFYQSNSRKDSEAQLRLNDRIAGQTRLYAYKAPGLYRDVTLDDDGQVASIAISDTVHLKKLVLHPKDGKATLFHLTEPMYRPSGPFVGALECLKSKDLEWLGKKKVDGREANGFRHAFWTERSNHKWSYDFWIDAETKQLVARQVPGLDILDPDRIYEEDSRESGFFQHEIVFGPKLDDSLFSLEAPEGYALEVEPAVKITEEEVIEFLGIVAEYFDKTFPDRMPGFDHGEENDRLQKFKKMPKEERTAAQNRLVETIEKYMLMWLPGPGPTYTFMQANIVDGSWRYIGKGVKLGDKGRIVCWYRLKDSQTYRAVYGDLSVKDVAAEDLPLPVER